jgi:hypothetical protein
LTLKTSLSSWILVFLSGCATTAYEPPSPEPYEPLTPAWSARPVSWEKLGEIEEWLRGSGPSRTPEYVPEAQLQLAEGRLALADRERGEIPPQVFEVRLTSAEGGFRQALARSDLSPSQKLRAERGLAHAKELRSGKAPARTAVAAAAPGGLSIEPRASWRAQPPAQSRLTHVSGPWTRITVHHSTKPTSELGRQTSAEVSGEIRDIQTVHMRDEGWGDIGYHFLIDPTGRIWQGRLLEWQGAHASGANNIGNIGICLLGNFNRTASAARASTAIASCARRSARATS